MHGHVGKLTEQLASLTQENEKLRQLVAQWLSATDKGEGTGGERRDSGASSHSRALTLSPAVGGDTVTSAAAGPRASDRPVSSREPMESPAKRGRDK